MAKSAYGPGIPADQPATVGPGALARKERDFFADPSPQRGFYVGFSDTAGSFGEGLAGKDKGNRRPSLFAPQTGLVSFKLKGKR